MAALLGWQGMGVLPIFSFSGVLAEREFLRQFPLIPSSGIIKRAEI